jgi:hypothetical protein
VHQRFSVRDRDGDGEGLPGGDGHGRRLTRFDRHVRGGVQGDGGARPTADEDLAAALSARRAVVCAQAGVELDDRLDRAAARAESTDEQGGGKQPAGDFADHALGQSEAPAGGIPGRFDGGRAGAVAAGADRRRVDRAESEGAGGWSADEPTEDGLAVEAGDTQPVDGAVGGDEGSAGVAHQRVVLDRRLAAPVVVAPWVRGHGRSGVPVGSADTALYVVLCFLVEVILVGASGKAWPSTVAIIVSRPPGRRRRSGVGRP